MYGQTIRETVARLGRIGIDPRHVEGWMRLEHSTLDHLDRHSFDAEVAMAIALIDHAGADRSESLARSYGL